MLSNIPAYSLKKGLVLLGMGLLAAMLVSVVSVGAQDSPEVAEGKRLVTIYDSEQEQTVVTSATTVRSALQDAGVSLEQTDAVEPELDSELVAKNYHINIYRARPVLIIDGPTRIKVMTAEQGPKQIMEVAKQTLHDEDLAEFERVNDVIDEGGAGLKLVVDRATPFTFVLYGKSVQARSHAATVGEMLAEKGVELTDKDGLNVKLSTPLTLGMKVEVWRDGKQTITVEEAVKFPVEQVQDTAREIGYRDVKTPGKNGKQEVTYEIEMRNGKEVSRKKIQSVVIEEPTKQVEIVGAKPSFSGSFAEALVKLRQCEAGGNYAINTGNGYYGAYQYDIGTWGGYKGYPNAAEAPPSVQDQKAWETYQARGWSPWPSCGSSLPDTYR